MSVDYKPRAKGTPRFSRNARAYENGILPAEHALVMRELKVALGAETEGTIVLQRVIEKLKMARTSVLRIIDCLVKYGYLEYRADRKAHSVYVKILKKEEEK